MSFFARTLRRWYRAIPQDEAGRLQWGRYFRRLFLKFLAWFFGITIGLALLYLVLPVPVTMLMVQRCFEQGNDPNRPVRLYKDWVSFDNLSPNLQLAVVCAEDQYFLEHNGFDYKAIRKAFQHNLKSARVRGGSTISQQTAKNVFLWPARSIIRKGLETYFTIVIETLWSKRRIMTVYLNVIEFGDGIYGAEAAARHYFGKSARELTREEAALLASILPSPLRYSAGTPSSFVKRRQAAILRQMRRWNNRLNYDLPNTPNAEER